MKPSPILTSEQACRDTIRAALTLLDLLSTISTINDLGLTNTLTLISTNCPTLILYPTNQSDPSSIRDLIHKLEPRLACEFKPITCGDYWKLRAVLAPNTHVEVYTLLPNSVATTFSL